MKPNQLNKNLRRIAAICVASAFATASMFAQQINAGVDMTELFTPNNFIYYGWYDHATALDAANNVTTREGATKPIVWRIMGKENGVDNYITLLSEYVLDSRPYGSISQKWDNSDLRNWLNSGTGFQTSFSTTEFGEVKQATVYAPSFKNDATMAYVGSDSPSPSTDYFYIPWGTPNQSGTTGNENKVFWTVGDGSGTIPGATYEVDPNYVRAIGLKDRQSHPQYNVYYWLRPMATGANGDVFLLVKSDNLGPINIAGIGQKMGVRPMFKLDTAKILFAAEIMAQNSINRLDQIQAVSGDYKDEDQLPNGGSGGVNKAYKLTLQSSVYTLSTNFLYDLDETVATVSDTVALKPGEKLGFKLSTPPTLAAGDGLAQKIVGWNTLQHYNFNTRTDSLFVTADNIYTPTVMGIVSGVPTPVPNNDYDALDIGYYTTYVWAQKNVALQSNEGSTPQAFTTRVLDDNTAPVLSTFSSVRNNDNSADITINITESNLGGKYYYIIENSQTPVLNPTTFDDFVTTLGIGSATPVTPKMPFRLSSATGQVTLHINAADLPSGNVPHVVYIIAKDLVRNVSNILTVTVPQFYPNNPPIPKANPYAITLSVGETYQITADSIATDIDPPTDVITIDAITSGPTPTGIATATLNTLTGEVSIYGITSGYTSIIVDVQDHASPPSSPVSIQIDITVKETPPTISIDYVEEDLVGFLSGASYSINGGSAITPGTLLDSIPEDWFDTTISIVKISSVNSALNSPPQLLYIPPRPAPPTVIGVRESFTGYSDGELLGVNDSMQYRVVGDDDWLAPPRPGRTAVEYLAPGEYSIRYKAIANVQFASLPTTATIGYGTVVPTVTRAVYLPEIPGMEMIPAPGVYYVESSGTFTFTVKFSNAMLGVWSNRTVNGQREVLSGTKKDSNTYEYKIENITSGPVVIYIGGEYVANEAVPSTAVWSSNGAIHFDVVGSQTVSVYSLDGQLVNKVKIPEGKSSIPTPNGIYIVLAGERRYKVAVN